MVTVTHSACSTICLGIRPKLEEDMTNALPQHADPPAHPTEQPEPADTRMYVTLSIAFMAGMVFLMGLFIAMLLILAHAG
jgi:hypothetical protein